jgi:hypothetical protein
MAFKQVFFRSEARERILRGVTALADAVRVTLGPKSKCVLLEKRFGPPVVCNDGVTIERGVGGEPAAADRGHVDRGAREEGRAGGSCRPRGHVSGVR